MVETASDTADFLLLFDKIFDSINGSSMRVGTRKPLRCAVSSRTQHVEFWQKVIPILESICFITYQPVKTKTKVLEEGSEEGSDVFTVEERETVPPRVTNWIKTITGFLRLRKNLQALGLKFFSICNCNQDPLENFFGGIHCQGVRNVNPDCRMTRAAIKTLIINNLSLIHI